MRRRRAGVDEDGEEELPMDDAVHRRHEYGWHWYVSRPRSKASSCLTEGRAICSTFCTFCTSEWKKDVDQEPDDHPNAVVENFEIELAD